MNLKKSKNKNSYWVERQTLPFSENYFLQTSSTLRFKLSGFLQNSVVLLSQWIMSQGKKKNKKIELEIKRSSNGEIPDEIYTLW